MFSIFLLKQVKYFLADKNTCVILCEFLNKDYYYYGGLLSGALVVWQGGGLKTLKGNGLIE